MRKNLGFLTLFICLVILIGIGSRITYSQDGYSKGLYVKYHAYKQQSSVDAPVQSGFTTFGFTANGPVYKAFGGAQKTILDNTNAGSALGLTAKSFVYADASSALVSTSNPTNGQLLIGSTGAIPVKATLTGTANQVVVTNGAGSITLSTPQSIAVASTPTFASLTLSGLTQNAFAYSGTAGLISTTASPLNGELLIGSTGVAPVKATLTGTANQVVVTNGAGSITLSLPQSIASSSSPQFTGLTLTGTLVKSTVNITMGVGSSSLNAALGDIETITGDAGTNTITSITNGTAGQILHLRFVDNLVTISDAGTLKLAGAFSSTADDTLTLLSDGTNWYEISRSVN